MYSEKVIEHFTNPRNVGEIENPDGEAEVGNPVCGDVMKITFRLKGDVIEDIKFKTFGCGAAIATSSMITEMVKGRKLEDALKVTDKDVAEALGGLPNNKRHCSSLAYEALQLAVENWRKKNQSAVV